MPAALITDILVVLHNPLTSDASEQRASVGLVIDEQLVVWQECVVWGQGAALAESVQGLVAPAWVGRMLDDTEALLAELDALSEEVTLTELLPVAEDDASGLTRRALLTGQFWRQRPAAAPTHTVTRYQALRPALRYALSLALITAQAQVQRNSLAELMADYCGTTLPTTPMPIVRTQQFPGRQELWQPGAAWGWRLPSGEERQRLGQGGAALQGVLRQTRRYLQQFSPGQWPSRLLVQADAWFDQAFDGDVGKVLGALYGLERVVKPLPLSIENPFPATASRLDAWRTLREYLDFRDMQVQLIAHTADVEDAAALLAAGVLAGMRISPAQVGSVRVLRDRVQQCRAAGVSVILSDDDAPTPASLQQLGSVALAVRADLLAVPADAAVWLATLPAEAMQRQLAWSDYRSK
ncbi:MAG: hypothetical protein GXP37_00410 [Chloroflexi bacterium]|nr:hypothetical protein [Chloroflexota bacterium]